MGLIYNGCGSDVFNNAALNTLNVGYKTTLEAACNKHDVCYSCVRINFIFFFFSEQIICLKPVTYRAPKKPYSAKFEKISKKNSAVEFTWKKVIYLKRTTVRNRCGVLCSFLNVHNIFLQRKMYSCFSCCIKVRFPFILAAQAAVGRSFKLWLMLGRFKTITQSAQRLKVRSDPTKTCDFIA